MKKLFWKEIYDVNIFVSDAPTPEYGVVVLAVGQEFPLGADPKGGMDKLLTIEVSRWRRRVRVTYSSGSVVTYKDFRCIIGEKKRLN